MSNKSQETQIFQGDVRRAIEIAAHRIALHAAKIFKDLESKGDVPVTTHDREDAKMAIDAMENVARLLEAVRY